MTALLSGPCVLKRLVLTGNICRQLVYCSLLHQNFHTIQFVDYNGSSFLNQFIQSIAVTGCKAASRLNKSNHWQFLTVSSFLHFNRSIFRITCIFITCIFLFVLFSRLSTVIDKNDGISVIFSGRCSLNTTNGYLAIKRVNGRHAGRYTAEIDGITTHVTDVMVTCKWRNNHSSLATFVWFSSDF